MRQYTSILAERSLSLFDKATQRTRILDAIVASSEGLTDSELQERLRLDGSTERPRRGELLKAGSIEDSGKRRVTPSGRQAIIWKAIRADH